MQNVYREPEKKRIKRPSNKPDQLDPTALVRLVEGSGEVKDMAPRFRLIHTQCPSSSSRMKGVATSLGAEVTSKRTFK